MVLFPSCKINLGLHIIGKRTDGYHELETVFYPVGLKDALEVIESEHFHFETTGFFIAGNSNDNLCVKAYKLLKQDFPSIPPVSIHLHKAIPLGAGLGGGSADAAFMLLLLNKKFELNLSQQALLGYALQLGSDCPFFILNKPCYASGRGETLTPIELNLSRFKILLVHPGIHISTKEAFAALVPALPTKKIQQVMQQPVETWKDELKNDFEKTVFANYPSIKEIKQRLYNAGATYVSMSGSGSSVFGIFESSTEMNLSFPENYFVKTVQ